MSILFLAALVPVFGGRPAQAQFSPGLYASTDNPAGVYQIGQSSPVVSSSNLSAPYGIGFSSSGSYMYVVDASSDSLKVIDANTQAVVENVSLAQDSKGNTLSGTPVGLAVDATGNVYVSLNSSSSTPYDVIKISDPSSDLAQTPTITSFSNGVKYASALAVDSNGNVYIGQGGVLNDPNTSAQVYKVGSLGGTATAVPNSHFFDNSQSPSTGAIATTVATPGLAVDNHYLYISYKNSEYYTDPSSTFLSGGIDKISLSTGTASVVLKDSTSALPFGLALDPSGSGNLYFDATNNGKIYDLTSPGTTNNASLPTAYSMALAGSSPSYMSFHNAGTANPEPGSLALGVVVTLAGVVGWAVNRRRTQGARS